ncbi:MAG: hypothetical protein QJT81_04100 [Candidatus Thiothrix putei]|uniref:Uncharacterized protein n=2 Tax=Thiothrix TaxID=1030 RepID=A0A1H4G732_9GAMM|nr:hypothetical protein [Thiothrix caldifontis]WGZ95184.1 MAG: hypothetical protein QJT81_04100 [Candidatus Thiothrix putei]SEB04850.1 hypothetical protein SAMN05660964_03285 [Thiothrix caldifontis]
MQHESDGRDEDDDDTDPVMERELKALYQAALLDEDFQQQVHDNVQALSDAERQKLSKQPSIQPFLHDELMPAPLQARLRALQAEKKKPWWKTLWSPEGWVLLPLPGPAFSLPAVLVIGGLLGVLLTPTLLTPQVTPEEWQLRSTTAADDATGACEFSEALRGDPDTWWAAIQQCEQQAQQQVQRETMALQQRYPNFQPSNP